MRISTVLLALMFTSSAAHAGTKKQIYEFNSAPSGAVIVLATPNGVNGYKRSSCTTPCTLKAKPDPGNLFHLSLAGYQSEFLLMKDAVINDGRVVFEKKLLTQAEADAIRKRKHQNAQAVFENSDKCNIKNMTDRSDNSDAEVCRRINPAYPVRAMSEGIEGKCDVTINVSAAGTVDTVQTMVCSAPEFVCATERAVMKWKFFPRRIDGENVEAKGLTFRINFKMEDYISPSPKH